MSLFPVGLITKAGVSSPIIRNGTFAGFYDGWIGGRKFAVDMAGFAISVQFLLSRPQASMPYKPGFEEDGFLKSLAPFEPFEAELLASNCTKVSLQYSFVHFPYVIFFLLTDFSVAYTNQEKRTCLASRLHEIQQHKPCRAQKCSNLKFSYLKQKKNSIKKM